MAPVIKEQVAVMHRLTVLEQPRNSDPRFTKAGHRSDAAHKRVSFIGFPANTPEFERIKSMQAFMTKHFKHVPIRFADNIASDGPPGKSKVTLNGFVEVGSSHAVSIIMEKVKKDNLKLDNLAGVIITRGISDLDRRRNWALHKAGELVRADNAGAGGNIATNKKDRNVMVDDQIVYSQKDRYDLDCIFECSFKHVLLP